MNRVLPEGFVRGPLPGQNIIGEITESLHKFRLEGWTYSDAPPRMEEDLSFVPKDREEVVYIYMYRAGQNQTLLNSKRWRVAPVTIPHGEDEEPEFYYERAPLYLDLFYLICVHSKFRSDAERLLGWVMLRLYEGSHLIYRPKRYLLPDGRVVDSTGRPWSVDSTNQGVVMEKVAVNLVDDLTVGDAVNFFTLHEAPYRPYLTYQARCAMDGALLSAPPTTVRASRPEAISPAPGPERPNGRLPTNQQLKGSRIRRTPFGPKGYRHRPLTETHENED